MTLANAVHVIRPQTRVHGWAMRTARLAAAACSILFLGLLPAGADWPTFRADNNRSGTTDSSLTTPLHLQWRYTPRHAPRPAWPQPGKEMHRMAFDYAFQVAVTADSVFFGSSADHKVYALDAATGRERWSVFTEGPVRFAPVAAGERVFAASDDGCLYCLDADSGKPLWLFRGGPRDERLIGNGCMVSRWPTRTGVLLDGDRLYFTVGMWSSDGVFVYALRSSDGSVVWVNDTCNHLWMGVPHALQESMGGVAPQGYLALHKGVLIVPNGRAMPAGFDAATGELLYCDNPSTKLHHAGGARVFAAGGLVWGGRRPMQADRFVHLGEADPAPSEGLIAWDYHTGAQRVAVVYRHRAVIAGGVMYATGNGVLGAVAMDKLLARAREYTASGKNDETIPYVQPTYHPAHEEIHRHCGTSLQAGHSRNAMYPWFGSKVAPVALDPIATWRTPMSRTYELILAGDTLVAGGDGLVAAFSTDGGKLAAELRDAGVPANEIEAAGGLVLVRRGALPGAGQWTHEYADAGRSAASDDRRVRLPLRMLWFGGPGPARIVSRHWRGPAPLFVKGRMFVAGENHVMALDAYNGRELWCRELPGAGRFPCKYRGGHIAADDAFVYAVQDRSCVQLYAKTGSTARTFEPPPETLDLPVPENPVDRVKNGRAQGFPVPNKVEWDALAVTDELVIGTVGVPNFSWTWWPEAYPEGGCVFALRKSDGSPAWVYRAECSVSPNAICVADGRVFLIDRTSEAARRRAKRQGKKLSVEAALKALDAATGKVLWQTSEELVGNMLWSRDEVLLVTGNIQKTAYRATDGKVLWSERVSGLSYPVLVNDTAYMYPRAYDLRTGLVRERTHPLTGEAVPWRIQSKGGCGSLSGCPSTLFFRAGATGFYDLARDSGLHWLGQTRTGCWVHAIAAGGMVLMPESSSSCTCPYNFQTSVAMVADTRYENWSVYPRQDLERGARFRHLAVNFGAPGDQRAADGKLWLAFPRPFRPGSLTLPMFASPSSVDYRRRNADRVPVAGTDTPWVYTGICRKLRRLVLELAIAPPAPSLPCPEEPQIDGQLTDSCWDGRGPLRFSTDDQTVDDRLTAFLRHDSHNIYVGFKRCASLRDGKPVPWTANVTKRDGPVWRDDSLNVRFGQGSKVVYLCLSATGALYDGFGTHSARPRWNGNVRSAVHLTPLVWTAEIAVPWEALAKAKFARERLRVFLECNNRTGVGPERVQYKYRTWRRYGLYANMVPVGLVKRPPSAERTYEAVLHFAEIEDVKPGQRVFDVRLQGQAVLKGFDIAKEAGGTNRAVVRRIPDVRAADTLLLELVPRGKRPPIINGLELLEK